jgi:hypothetical protein
MLARVFHRPMIGHPKNGWPTMLDDEVLVGLGQLTKRRSTFAGPKVTFAHS